MDLSPFDGQLIAALQDGLPLAPRPYELIAQRMGTSEAEVMERIQHLIGQGVINRFGVIVRHHEVGYRANAMAVWDVPDQDVTEAGHKLATLDFVTLSYRRPRRLPDWPYNLFCMIHGRQRGAVEELVTRAADLAGLSDRPGAVLFSQRRFKQRGARYPKAPMPAMVAEAS